MKKFPVIAVLFFSLVCALGLEWYRASKKSERDRAEWKQIGDNLGESLQETQGLLEDLPKVGK